MYLTAQRVRSTQGVVGINAARYEHNATDVDWTRADVLELVTTQVPGRRVAEKVEVQPGGNSVLSYIDIVALSAMSPARVNEVVEGIANDRSSDERGRRSGQGWWVEYLLPRSQPNRSDELIALRGALLQVANTPDHVTVPPLLVLVSRDEAKWVFELDPSSKQRVSGVRTDQPQTGRVRVPFDVADDFIALHGELYPHVAEWLTNLSRDELTRLGGVEFVHEGRSVWQLPTQSSARS